MRRAVGLGAKMGQVNPQNPKQSGSPARGMALRVPLAISTWQPGWGVAGVDVSAYQANGATDTTDWQGQWNQGVRFAYVKASEGNYYTNAAFPQQYTNSMNAGMVRGAYHFAIPNWSSGNNQANYFVQNGGGWSPDGITMPPVLDIEYNPYKGQTINGVNMGDTCYNMGGSAMVNWIADFSNTMLSLTGRRPMIYTTADWWSQCTGNFGGFANNPLWVAAYNQSGPTLPAGWGNFSVWQYSSTGPFVGDSNVWNGDYAGLQRFATYGDTNPSAAIGAVAGGANIGAQTGGVFGGLVNGGAYQNFQNGSIIWSAATGAQISPSGPIRGAWQASGFESGPLGYPTTGVVTGLVNGGTYQNFQNGSVIWSQATGAQVSPNGPIRDAWKATGFEGGPLGYPTSGVVGGLANGGTYQNYQNGAIIWNQATGAQVSPNGPIRTFWLNSGAEQGPLGYPTSGVVCGLAGGGCYENFQNGAIMWSQATGAQLSPSGPIRTAWLNSGAEQGPLAYPTTGVVTGLVNGGTYQNYQNGAVIWSQATGAQLSPSGPIRTAWFNSGAEQGPLAYPTTGVVTGLVNGGSYQNYQNGAVIWSQATGAQLSPSGPIRTAWLNSGAERGPLAYPTTGVVTGLVNGGSYQNYQNGAVIWSQATGAQLSPSGPIRTAWLNSGAERGRYGYPTSGQTCNGAGTSCSQAFQGGSITWNSATGIS
ncbi:GH25 family lysozyme [Sinomonas albida]|uniref:GH25 family lysozyme n=1 Tax=Sinomonas albida TaxID=369942 RepID=UPI0010A7E4B2|nr:GH25 family lysozyme [Sinomonas albida]